VIELVENTFRCPGETYTISHAVHLGRLAAFDERCRRCAHRHATGSLPTALVEELRASWARDEPPLFEAEGAAGLVGETLTAQTSRRLAAAFGTMLVESTSPAASPAMVLAGDGRPAAADLVAAASDGLRWSGCQVIEVPAATAACLVFTQQRASAAGALLIGNAAGTPRTAGLRFFGPGGQPLSANGNDDGLSLAELSCRFEHRLDRPARRYGGWRRGSAEQEYIGSLAGYFHALRPLKFVLETSCAPLRRYLDQLLASVACRGIPPAEAAQLPAGSLHFGFWMDGDGERCQVSDEQGRTLDPHAVLVLLCEYLLSSRAGAVVIVEDNTPAGAVDRLEQAGARVVCVPASRAAVQSAMRRHEAILGGGSSGRFWLPSLTPLPDALHVLALLLGILSQSDRPLSDIV
jgi:phosphomannomutase